MSKGAVAGPSTPGFACSPAWTITPTKAMDAKSGPVHRFGIVLRF